jgi:hypothetical protein
VNILLVSSEHSFPFRLANPRLKFSLSNLKKIIFAGEVPPDEMFKLLTSEWKIESNLAKSLIDIYGGHIWDVFNSLEELEEMKCDFEFLDPELSTCVQKCVDWKGEEQGDKERMIKALEQLAKTGILLCQTYN